MNEDEISDEELAEALSSSDSILSTGQAALLDLLTDDASLEEVYNQSGPQGVIDALNERLQVDSENPKNHYHHGNILRYLGQLDEAVDAYARSSQLNPDDDSSYYQQAVVLDDLGRFNDAANAYGRVISLLSNPSKEDYVLYGYALSQSGRMDEAVNALNKAVSMGMCDAEVFLYLGHALFVLKNYDDAIIALKKATELDSGLAAALYYLGFSLFDSNKPEEAKSVFQSFIALSDKDELIKEVNSVIAQI